MTDKHIIINGVDVSRCSNYDHNSYFECKVYYCHCDEIPNCRFKQLKRKEQECEQLKQTLIEIKPVLELYANSKIGEEQLYGTYKIIVADSKVLGGMYITFDPRPAKQALQKISEVLKNE